MVKHSKMLPWDRPARVRPIFLFSLPRSGSTLLQRMLATHAEIATATEPWFLLPYLYTLRENGAYAEYGHSTMVAAIRDLCDDLPNGRADYLAQVRQLALGLYENLTSTETYFLDRHLATTWSWMK